MTPTHFTFAAVNFLGGQVQNQRSRAFSLTGQMASIQGALVGASSCQFDWITIPCATNNGRTLQTGGTVCQDRICGDTFNSEASQTQSPVFSEYYVAVAYKIWDLIVKIS
jgi:hypothetical protein